MTKAPTPTEMSIQKKGRLLKAFGNRSRSTSTDAVRINMKYHNTSDLYTIFNPLSFIVTLTYEKIRSEH